MVLALHARIVVMAPVSADLLRPGTCTLGLASLPLAMWLETVFLGGTGGWAGSPFVNRQVVLP